MHKAGSTTVSNLLARYALNHDLHIALPDLKPMGSGFHCFGAFHPDHVMSLADNQRYGVLFNHMIYNRTALDAVMPADSFYLAIMREPVERFVSSAYYYQMLKPPLRNNTNNGAFKAFISEQNRGKLETDMKIYNSLSHDTGLPVALHTNGDAVRRHIERLERELDLMMVLEHFLESLVLLKRRACLSLKDVIFMKGNARQNHKIHHITPADRAQLRQWQSADHAVYDHFYAKFLDLIHQEEAQGFREELDHFRVITGKVTSYCSGRINIWDTLVVKESRWNQEFTVNTRDCQIMNMAEATLQKLLLTRAKSRRAQAGYKERRRRIPPWTPQC